MLTETFIDLGRPYFQTENCLIYNLDCLEAMKKMPSECINLTVTSPPYNIGKEYENILPNCFGNLIDQLFYANQNLLKRQV